MEGEGRGGVEMPNMKTQNSVDIKADDAHGDAEVATGFTLVDNCEQGDAKCIFMLDQTTLSRWQRPQMASIGRTRSKKKKRNKIEQPAHREPGSSVGGAYLALKARSISDRTGTRPERAGSRGTWRLKSIGGSERIASPRSPQASTPPTAPRRPSPPLSASVRTPHRGDVG